MSNNNVAERRYDKANTPYDYFQLPKKERLSDEQVVKVLQ
jgi:hypothetical protein